MNRNFFFYSNFLPVGARNSPGLPPDGGWLPCPGGPVRKSGGPPAAPGGGYSPATAAAAAIPAKLAGSKPVTNKFCTNQKTSNPSSIPESPVIYFKLKENP